jgi:hypothetical protein
VIFSIQGKKPLRVHLAAAQRHRLHSHIMDRRGVGVMMVVMPMMVVIMVMVFVVAVRAALMIVVVVVRFQEMRIVLQRARQVERAAVEHLGQVDLPSARCGGCGRRD